jgi:hypothetical protein
LVDVRKIMRIEVEPEALAGLSVARAHARVLAEEVAT